MMALVVLLWLLPSAHNRPSICNTQSSLKQSKKHMEWTLRLATSQALATTIRLGILPTLTRTRSITDMDYTQQQISRDKLLVLLRLLSAEGIVREDPLYSFRLVDDFFAENSYLVEYCLDESLWKAWNHLETKDPFQAANHMTLQEHFSKDRGHLNAANRLVEYVARWETDTCLDKIQWDDFKSIVDLGGHRGVLMEQVARRYPHVQCKSLDLPSVAENYPDNPIEIFPGDLFDHTTYPNADLFFMKHILLCEFDATDSLRILNECRKSNVSHIIVAETVLPDTNREEHILPFALDTMMLLDGRDRSRTESEWNKFAMKAGFRVDRVDMTQCPTCSLLYLTRIE